MESNFTCGKFPIVTNGHNFTESFVVFHLVHHAGMFKHVIRLLQLLLLYTGAKFVNLARRTSV